jgi:nicotinamide riboside kinase
MDNNVIVRIAISGSAGTGKTTLCHQIEDKFNIPVVSEGAREYLIENNLTLDEAKKDLKKFQYSILNNKVKKIDELIGKNLSFICDRSPIDNAVYAMLGSKKEDDFWVDKYNNECVEQLSKFTHIVTLPWDNFKIEEDGIRHTNKWTEFLVNNTIFNMVYSYQQLYNYIHIKLTKDDNYFDRLSSIIDNYIKIKTKCYYK